MGWSLAFDGLSAIATTGALAAAIIAGRQARKLYDIESDRDDQRRQTERRRQAAHISAWAAMQIEPGGKPVFGVIVRNSSDDPVYSLRTTCRGFTTAMTPKLHCVPPGEYFIANVDQRKPDGRSFPWDFAKPVREIRNPVRPFTASEKKRVDEIAFRDSAGTRWVRTARGELTPSG